jgi:glycosyltransferase involved in cell wall biosynthesis
MQILIISQYFWPENFRINDLAVGLKESNIGVTILTGYPSYPNQHLFKNIKLNNYYNKMQLIRVPIFSRGENKLSLFLNYLSFVFSAIFIGYFKLYFKKFDVIFVFQPSPITSILPAIFFSKLKKTKTAIWILDLWPDTLKPMGLLRNALISKIAFNISNLIYKKIDLIFAQSISMSNLLKKRLPNNKIKYLPNWVEEDFFKNSIIKKKKKDKRFNIIFAGNLGLAQDFNSIIKAFVLIPNKSDFQLTLIGEGKEKVKIISLVKESALSEVIKFRKAVPLNEIPKILYQADALILALKKADVFKITIPGKLQSYLAIGLPIISMLSGESASIIEKNKLGLNAKAGDYKSLAINIVKLKEMSKLDRDLMGKRGKEFAKNNFTRNVIIKNFIKQIKLIK